MAWGTWISRQRLSRAWSAARDMRLASTSKACAVRAERDAGPFRKAGPGSEVALGHPKGRLEQDQRQPSVPGQVRQRQRGEHNRSAPDHLAQSGPEGPHVPGRRAPPGRGTGAAASSAASVTMGRLGHRRRRPPPSSPRPSGRGPPAPRAAPAGPTLPCRGRRDVPSRARLRRKREAEPVGMGVGQSGSASPASQGSIRAERTAAFAPGGSGGRVAAAKLRDGWRSRRGPC